VKGSDRNRRCECGSGRKVKHCLPSHPPTPEEMDRLHGEALFLNHLRDNPRARGPSLFAVAAMCGALVR
jgi:hypothetical protein